MKILIDKCIPLNNGDAALIFSLAKQLEGEYEIEFSTTHYSTVKSIYPKYSWHKSLLGNRWYRKIFKLFPILGKFITFIYLVLMNNEYKKSDVIIAAPGGYLHSYYGIEDKLYIWHLCKKYLKKTVGLYSQSLGELKKRDQNLFYKYGSEFDFIFLRDSISYKRAKEYGLSKNLVQTKDAAFMLNLGTNNKTSVEEKKVIGFSVRDWSNENRDVSTYYALIGELIHICLEMGYRIYFLSTCQGLENYVDDSKTAKKVLQELGLENDERIAVDNEFYDLREFENIIQDFDFVVGTRLHMCILSLINNVPAFNISYEEKGKEVYDYLNIPEYSIDYNQTENIVASFRSFLTMEDKKKEHIFSNVEKVRDEQLDYLNQMKKIINNIGK